MADLEGPRSFDVRRLARPNILALQPYRCARDDYKDDGTNVLLDANENAFGPGLALDAEDTAGGLPPALVRGLHRYPDPHLTELKQDLCDLRNPAPTDDAANGTANGSAAAAAAPAPAPRLTPAHLFCGVGSDEVIDALLRAFCVPGTDAILTCPPTYGMYDVSAAVNDVRVVKVPQRLPAFDLDVPAVLAALAADRTVKLVYLCSPGNPTGRLLPPDQVRQLLESDRWEGLVVLDEAYVDFAATPEAASLAGWVPRHPRLVVMQTLSKAFGLAGARLGACFADPSVAALLNAMKAPYNVSAPAAHLARAALAPASRALTREHLGQICEQRARLLRALPAVPGVGGVRGGLDANFVLVEILDAPRGKGGRPCNETAREVYERLAGRRGVVVRFRGREYGCEGCLRVTVGTEQETGRLLTELRLMLFDVFAEKKGGRKLPAAAEEAMEAEASAVVS